MSYDELKNRLNARLQYYTKRLAYQHSRGMTSSKLRAQIELLEEVNRFIKTGEGFITYD